MRTRTSSKAPVPLLCQMMSPGYYSPTSSQYVSIAGQALPPPNVCDYVILDIPTNSTHGYNRLDYDFLKGMSQTSKFLFTLPRDPGISTDRDLINMTSFVDQQNFRSVARELYNYMPVRGFGYLHFNYSTIADLLPLASYVVNVYQKLLDSLKAEGYQEIANFITIQFSGFPSKDEERDFYARLNGVVHFIVSETFSVNKRSCHIEAVSSYDRHCYTGQDSPSVKASLAHMLSVPNPKSTFVLSLNLQAIKYRVSSFVTRPSAKGSPKSQPCLSFEPTSFERGCYHSVFRTTAPLLPRPFNSSEYCQFIQQTNYIFTYETDESLEFKIVEAFKVMQQNQSPHIITWIVYNLTKNSDHAFCGGQHHRLFKIRQVFDNFTRVSKGGR